MDKKYNLSRNNSGSTIIIVILCIAFVSILCSLLLSITVNNLEMKVISQKSKSNFYNAESALDEIKTGLEKVTADAFEDAYKDVMKQYIYNTEEQKKFIFSKAFVDGIAKILGGDITSTTYDIGNLNNYIINTTAQLDTIAPENSLEKNIKDVNYESITLKNIKISYTDSNYKTTISSDIIIKTPNMSFNAVSSSTSPFFDYGLIADDKILVEAALNVAVEGNIYAGNKNTTIENSGILITNGSDLTINNATNIVTRGDISVSGHSKLNVFGNPNVWAKNIATLKLNESEAENSITINGVCYVADDLMLNAKNSNVTIAGEYYGYSYNANKETLTPVEKVAENSSAIIINGTNANLDLSGTNRLLLAGRAYLDPKSCGNSDDTTLDKVLTGESLAIKGIQNAYLVPSECMPSDFNMNPVPSEKFKDVYKANNLAVDAVNYNSYSLGDKKLSDYADGCSKIFYNKPKSQGYVYYFLKFKSEQKANEYLQKYYVLNNTALNIGIIDNQVKSYTTSIKLHSPLNSILSAGNIFRFDAASGKSALNPNNVNPEIKPDGTKNESLIALEKVATILVKRYDAIQETLVDTSTKPAFDKTSLFNSIVMTANIISDVTSANGYTNGVKRVQVGDNIVYIVNNAAGTAYELEKDTTLPNDGMQGIVIATGSVNVNKSYNGLILSGDKIILKADVKINNSITASSIIEAIIGANNPDVNRYFRDYVSKVAGSVVTGTTNNQIIISDLIVYDNWKKNKY